uniref:Putative ovule protein n=1 Tax=Solanum chacoense TaxID=4108 RepID=A0A0V0GNC5_SOLCH
MLISIRFKGTCFGRPSLVFWAIIYPVGDPPTWIFHLGLFGVKNIGLWLSIFPYSSNQLGQINLGQINANRW